METVLLGEMQVLESNTLRALMLQMELVPVKALHHGAHHSPNSFEIFT